MPFGSDSQRRYGHIPPVQYPVAGQHPHPLHQQPEARQTTSSSAPPGHAAPYQQDPSRDNSRFQHGYGYGAQPSTSEELFINSPAALNAAGGERPAYDSASYQHHDPTPPPQPSFNPHAFSSNSNPTLPPRPHPLPTHPSAAAAAGSWAAPASADYVPPHYDPGAYAASNLSSPDPTPYSYSAQDQFSGVASPFGGSSTYTPPQNSSASRYNATSFSQRLSSPGPSSGQRPYLPNPNPASYAPASTYDPSRYGSGQYANYGSDPHARLVDVRSSGPQVPYPHSSQIPVGPNYRFDDQGDRYSRNSRSNSHTSTPPSPRASPRSSTGLQRHPTNAPLPSRPLDGYAQESGWNSTDRPSHTYDEYSDERITQESIIQEIEAELSGGQRNSNLNGRYSSDHDDEGAEEEDDDPEGTAGVLAMQQAELEDRRFSGNSFTYGRASASAPAHTLPPPFEEEEDEEGEEEDDEMDGLDDDTEAEEGVMVEEGQSSGSDFGNGFDLGMLSGGYAGNLAYGNDIGLPPAYYEPMRQGQDYGPAFDNAEVDYGGTGGLQAPRAERLSFDEGREDRVSIQSRLSGAESPSRDDYQEMPYYHTGLPHRPLPALPPETGSESGSVLSARNSLRSQYQRQHALNSDAQYYQAEGPATYYQNEAQQLTTQPERSISMSGGHSSTPPVQAPVRSRTDAAEERKKVSRHQPASQQGSGSGYTDYESSTGGTAGGFESITLPSGRKKKFLPSKLTSSDFRKCAEPWALSGIEAWIRYMGEGEMDLRTKTIEEAVTNLFTFKVPTMNVADAEALSIQVVTHMLQAEALLRDEEWVKFGGGHISGVLWQLTGSGCYAPIVHEHEMGGRCYSHHCTRTLKKVDLEDILPEDSKGADAWNVFYKLTKKDWEAKSKKEVERQNILHEIVTGEENYIKQLDIFRTLYRDDLRTRKPPIIHPDRLEKLLSTVFGKLDTVLRINKDHLLSQLKYRQQEQGPWIVGFSDLFREWVRKAKGDYIEYATGYPRATYMVRKEASRNMLFKKFLEDKQKHKSSSKQDWTHFLIAPLQRLQRYILLLESVDGKMIGDSEEKANLERAIQEIKAVTHECDAKVAETNRRVQMTELDRMLVLRPSFQSVLNLDHLGRVLIMEGELQRMGSKGVRWVDTHALLFDHYLILAKVVAPKDGKGEKKYDVSREPIPMPLLFLESMNDEAVMKQKGITAPLGRTTTAPTSGSQLSKVSSNASGKPGLEHVSTSSSLNAMAQSGSNETESKILYPFKVKHLGHEVYTLYAMTARDRLSWCTSIIEAKTRHAKALYLQNAEPFRLRVLADGSFHYDAGSPFARASGVAVKGTPLDRAIQEIETARGSAQATPPVCRAQVNCATGFSVMGKPVIAIGTDYGVFVSDPLEPRGWRRSVQASRVTQMAVLEEFSICLLIADKSLISYPLDVVAYSSDYTPASNDSPRRAPQRLAKDVSYFATAKMKDRMLVFYKRKEGLHTSFKVLEPIFHKATEKRSRLFGGRRPAATTDSFRDFDEFFFPTECYSLSLFQTYIAVATAKGVEMLTLDKKQPMSIPDLKAPAIANIAGRIRDQRPLGMFRLNENEFIVAYEDCAVYVDKHGDVSRTLIMEYTGKRKKARGATMYGQYLLLFNEDYVEVRNAENGRLRQIIAGRDVRVIDFGIRGPTGSNAAQSQLGNGHPVKPYAGGDVFKGTVKIAMCHPDLPGRQIVLEMLLNDGHAE